jgi:hypothetical protein
MKMTKTAILAATLLAVSGPAFAQGMEGHNPSYVEDKAAAGTASKNAIEENTRWVSPNYFANRRSGLGKNADGKTTFATTMESRAVTERGATH